MMYRVYTVSKKTGMRVEVIAEGLSEKSAENICEAWGWCYCDENGESFWMDYELAE